MISAVSLYSAGTGGILQTEERPYEIRLRGLGQKGGILQSAWGIHSRYRSVTPLLLRYTPLGSACQR